MPDLFYCSNKECNYHSLQPKTKIAQELDNYKLCDNCYKRGYRLKQGVTVVREIVKSTP